MIRLHPRSQTRTDSPALFTVAAAVSAVVSAGLAVLLSALPAAANNADPHADQTRVEQELAKTKAALETSTERAEAAGVAFEEADRLLPDVQRKLAEARGVLAAAHAAANTAARTAGQAAADLTEADQVLAAARSRVEQTRDEIGEYSANAYMGRDLAGMQGLLGAQNPADFVAGLTYLERVAGEERKILDSHTRARTEAIHSQSARAMRKLAADEAQRQAEASVREAASAEADAARAERAVADLIAQREQALAVAEQERGANEARIRELQAESDKIAAEIRVMATAPGGQVVRAGSRLPMPVRGWKSSDFGLRYDPFYKVWQLHAGVDLAAPAGSPIFAAESGKVFRAGWAGGYGNYTCLYHGTYEGKGLATCYAHQSAILVKVGQQVRQGEVIGRVGTTGASTGNHLHFEVRLDGTPVNPLPWLPGCLC
jgi:murein DD-endopeptidase MepM/ murein hydrolase activator NlpD